MSYGNETEADEVEAGTLAHVEISKIKADPNNPRKTFGKDEHDEMVASVKEHGIQMPLRLRVDGDGFIIVAGERRYRAAKAAKLKTVPAIIADTDGASVESLVENLVREDLNAIEEGDAYRALVVAGKTTVQIAKLVSRPEARIADRMLLAGMPEAARAAVVGGSCTLGQARGIAELANVNMAMAAALAWAASVSGSWNDGMWRLYFNLDRIDPTRVFTTCEACDGSGGSYDVEEEWVDCPKCHGEGTIESMVEDAVGCPEFFAWPIGNFGSLPMLPMMIGQLLPTAQERVKAARERGDEHYGQKTTNNRYFAKPPLPCIDSHSTISDAALAAGVVMPVDRDRVDRVVVIDAVWVSEYLPDEYDKAIDEYVSGEKRKPSSSSRGSAAPGELVDDAAKEARQAERDAAKAQRAKGRAFNEDLGIQIKTQLGEVPVTLEVMKLLVGTIISQTEQRDYNGIRGSGHALFQRFTGVRVFETTKAGDLKVPRSNEDRTEFVEAVYKDARKELGAAKTPEQALGVLARFLAPGLADMTGLPKADLNEMHPYRAEGWRKFIVARFTPGFRRRIPKDNGITGSSYAWRD